jgi:2-oxoglutarate ferredoxin oxidoreductase subunit delta
MKLWRTPFDSNPTLEPLGYVYINRDRCKGCGFCVEFCPRDVLKMGAELSAKGYQLAVVKDGTKCLACGFCELICPEFALSITLNNKTPVSNQP